LENNMMNPTKWTCCGLLLAIAAVTFTLSATQADSVGVTVAARAESAPTATPPAAANQPLIETAPAERRADSLYAVESAVQKARMEGAGENEVYRLRAVALSTQVIALITEREDAEKRWQLRLAAWRAERAQLDPADSPALQALRERRFSAGEQAWLDASEPVAAPQLILR
jgi:hypothetical protein